MDTLPISINADFYERLAMLTNTVTLSTVVDFANFCAQLTREGIAFHGIEESAGAYSVTITGY